MEETKKIKSVSFKNPDSRIVMGGHTISSGNLTVEAYQHLLAISPNHEAQFNVEYEEEEKKPSKPGKATDSKEVKD